MRQTKIFLLLTALLLLIGAGVPEGITVSGYDPETDYMALMIEAAAEGTTHALRMGAIYEQQRNLKIEDLGLAYAKTDYFGGDMDADEISAWLKAYSTPVVIEKPARSSLGYHDVTAYTWTGNPCASGRYPYAGCCACNGLPIGTKIYVEGYGTLTVEDRGGMSDPYAIDIYMDTYSACVQWGRQRREIFIAEE